MYASIAAVDYDDDDEQKLPIMTSESSSTTPTNKITSPIKTISRTKPSLPLVSSTTSNTKSLTEISPALKSSSATTNYIDNTPLVFNQDIQSITSPILEGLLARGEITPAVFERLWNRQRNTATSSLSHSAQTWIVHNEADLGTSSLPQAKQVNATNALTGGNEISEAYNSLTQSNSNSLLQASQSVLRMSKPSCVDKNWKAEDGVTLEWRNLCYTIQKSRRKGKEQILNDVCGEARPGEVVAILGGSGAGKTTLLNVLAGRITTGVISGDIRCNNYRRDRHQWKRSVGYVEQDDLMDESLTVHELLTYVALLKLPDDVPLSRKHERVEEVINQMRLGDCKHTLIGDSVKRGISGGERKRVHIGMELMTSPMCMFFDEPTTGLDAFNAYHVIDTIREAADTGGRTMILAIHQPRKEILEKFNKIILLSKGQLIFTGNIEDAITYFDTLGYPVPALTNPGDHFLDVSTSDSSTEARRLASDERIEKLANCWKMNFNCQKFPPFNSKPLPAVIKQNPTRPFFGRLARYWRRWSILAERNLLLIHRDQQTTYIIVVQTVLVIFLFGWLFWQQGLDQKSINNRLGILFFLGLERFLTGLFRIVRILPSQRPLIVRERSKSIYTASEIYFSKLLTDVITIFVQHVIILTALYFMIGFQSAASRYGIFIGIGAVLAIAAHSLGYLISAVSPSVEVGLVIATMLSSVYGMFAGNLIIPSNVPLWLRWITYSDPLHYSFAGWSQNEFRGLIFSCEDSKCFTDGESVLSFQDIEEVPIVGCYGVLLALWLIYTYLGYLAIRYTTRAKTIKTFM